MPKDNSDLRGRLDKIKNDIREHMATLQKTHHYLGNLCNAVTDLANVVGEVVDRLPPEQHVLKSRKQPLAKTRKR